MPVILPIAIVSKLHPLCSRQEISRRGRRGARSRAGCIEWEMDHEATRGEPVSCQSPTVRRPTATGREFGLESGHLTSLRMSCDLPANHGEIWEGARVSQLRVRFMSVRERRDFRRNWRIQRKPYAFRESPQSSESFPASLRATAHGP